MNIKVKDIDRIIEILNKKKEELINADPESSFEFKSNTIKYINRKIDKWYIKVTPENEFKLNQFLKDSKEHYPSYQDNWKVYCESSVKKYFSFPEVLTRLHSTYRVEDLKELGCIEITTDEFLRDWYLPF
jgi:hypothetical protein